MRTGAPRYRRSIRRTQWATRMSLGGRAFSLPKTEEVLVSQLRSGEEEAFKTLVTEQHAALIRMAMRYVANKETAEEVVQETWVAVIQGVKRFEGRSSLRAWICAILVHEAKDRGIQEKRQRPFSDFECKYRGHSDGADPSWLRSSSGWHESWASSPHFLDDRTPERLLAARQAVAYPQRAIEILPTAQKKVLVLRDVCGVRTKEVCQQLNISEANLHVRLHRARERVRMAVETALR